MNEGRRRSSESAVFLNVPNALSCVRIFLSIAFVYFLLQPGLASKAAALLVFAAASWTDYWDGYFARILGQQTAIGRLLDPIADKVLTLAAFLGFYFQGILPFWIALVMIARDFFITALRLGMPAGTPLVAPRSSGKKKTALQMSAILLVCSAVIAMETDFWQPRWTRPVVGFIELGMVGLAALTVWSCLRYVQGVVSETCRGGSLRRSF